MARDVELQPRPLDLLLRDVRQLVRDEALALGRLGGEPSRCERDVVSDREGLGVEGSGGIRRRSRRVDADRLGGTTAHQGQKRRVAGRVGDPLAGARVFPGVTPPSRLDGTEPLNRKERKMKKNPLLDLEALGQSIWHDFLRC